MQSLDQEMFSLSPLRRNCQFGIRERTYIVCSKDCGCPAWHYVLVVDDQDTLDKFKEKITLGNINVTDCGQVLKSGWGEDPPNDVQEEMEKYETSSL